ncbi:MAG TPA: DUF5916 domain-containing protein [Longimicrobiaceae bacterium]|nr:DUF5916 domain-containing protein [Longimicrobiaceae bacterium]
MRTLLLLTIPALFTATAASAQMPVSRVTSDEQLARALTATQLTGEIEIDGLLTEPAWATADLATDFVQREPDPGAEASRATEARVLFGADAVYVGVRLYDHPDSIAAQLTRRDNVGNSFSDMIVVGFDSYNDNRTGFVFGANPKGVEFDLMISEDQREDISWDAVWEVETHIDSLGWTAEFRIPLSQLRYNPDESLWGINFQRVIARHGEVLFWAPTPPEAPGTVSRFGALTGLAGLGSPDRLEIEPYVSSRLARKPGDAANPFYETNATGFSAGGDLKYGLTSGLTLTATINPDFGQVEVDPSQLNLSAFETFFPEKRPFFVEGSEIFRFGEVGSYNNYNFEEYFYSRRIGRSPQRNLEAEYVDSPDATTILGAAKVSGKVAGWTLGFMNAVTAEETAAFVEDEEGSLSPVGTATVEPLTNYFVGRLRRDLRGGATVIGGMFTATNRQMEDPEFTSFLHPAAYFAGVDFDHSWANEMWTLSGYVSASRVEGSPEAIEATQNSPAHYLGRPDADYIELDSTRTALNGYMYEVALQKAGNLHFSLDYKAVTPGFEIRDMGFQSRVDYHAFTTLLGRDFPEPSGIFRRRSIFAYTYHGWNFGGDPLTHGGAIGMNAGFKNFWDAGLTMTYRPRTYDDRLTRGGPIARQPGMWELALDGSTDPRRSVSTSGRVSYGETDAGARTLNTGISLEIRPTSSLRIDLGPSFNITNGTAQYVTTEEDPLATATFGERYVFGDIEQTTLALETRLDWTFSPELSLQLYLQPFVASGDYTNFKEFLDPGTYDFGIYGEEHGTLTLQEEDGDLVYTADPDGAGEAPAFAFDDPDFNIRSLRGNAVLRWEYRPGSELFFVWQQQRSGFAPLGDFDLSRDTNAIFGAPASNVFLIKATYWIGR